MRIEGADTQVSEMFYGEVVHVVLIFVSESWVLSAEIKRAVVGNHTGFLQQITGKWARSNPEGMWVMLEVAVVIYAVGMHLEAM